MPSTATYKCKSCGSDFTARTADRARGWARFCSKSCKAKEQERRTHQNARYHERQYRPDSHWQDYEDTGLMDGHGQWE